MWIKPQNNKQANINGWLANLHEDILKEEQQQRANRQREKEITEEINKVVGKGIENAVKDIFTPLRNK